MGLTKEKPRGEHAWPGTQEFLQELISVAKGRLCQPEQRQICQAEHGAFTDWACGTCAEYLRPEAISPWTWHLMFLHRLTSSNNNNYDQELADYRALQQEMTSVNREYSQSRQADWSQEMAGMAAAWNGFQQDWQGTLEQMAGSAFAKFDEISAQGISSGNLLAQSWREALAEITTEVDAFGEHLMQTLDQASQGSHMLVGGGSGGSTNDLLSYVGMGLGFGGIFHQGGILEAHTGLAVSPESLLADERLIKVQTGEGILPRDAMVQLGEENFEGLRSGRFQVNTGNASPSYDITIQVQSLDAASVAGMDWGKVVQRHLMPALEREMNRRW
jgi:hypothetical protein